MSAVEEHVTVRRYAGGAVPELDATNGNPPVATLVVDEFTLHALVGCVSTTAQNPRLRDDLVALMGEAERLAWRRPE